MHAILEKKQACYNLYKIDILCRLYEGSMTFTVLHIVCVFITPLI
jgi:hypothetical protein